MRTDSFFQGLMQAVCDYARDCGLDYYELRTGGTKPSIKKLGEDRDYAHVRRKADFRNRIDNLLAMFLEEQAALNKPPTADEFKSVPVLADDEVIERAHKFKESALKWLSEYKWEDLKSNDYDTARTAWYHLDGLMGVCAMNDDTKAAFLAAADKAGLTF